MSGLSTPSRKLSRTTTRVTPPSRRKSLLMQFRPDLGTGMEYQQTHRFATVAQRQHEQAGTTILPAVRVAHQGTGPVVDLGFLTGGGLNHHAGFGGRLATKPADKALDALIVAGEAVDVYQVLP